ncbi:MAG: NADH-quinone oxidoreductase subunit K [Pseudomonadota bacterium]
MSAGLLYALGGAGLFCIGLYGVAAGGHVLRRILAFNITGSGVFLTLVGLAQRAPHAAPDPAPHALVLTGIVVAVSATAFALALARRLHAQSGDARLEKQSLEE